MNLNKVIEFFLFLSLFLYIFFFLTYVREMFGKLFFLFFMTLNYAGFVSEIEIFLKYPNLINTVFLKGLNKRWIFIAVLIMTFPFIYYYIKRTLHYLTANDSPQSIRIWKKLWLLPAVLNGMYSIIYFKLTTNIIYNRKITFEFYDVLFLILFNGVYFLTYEIILYMFSQTETNLILQKENNRLSIVAVRYGNLIEKIEDTKRAQHDLRHHFSVVYKFLQKNDRASLFSYLKNYGTTLPNGEGLPLCENIFIDAVVGHYNLLAHQSDTEMFFSLDVPSVLPLPENDFCCLLGNLLENALEACQRMKAGRRFIRVTIRLEGRHMLVVVIENSYEGEVRLKDGAFLSSKRKGFGTGLSSVHFAAKKYNGLLKCEYKNGIFCTNVFLNP